MNPHSARVLMASLQDFRAQMEQGHSELMQMSRERDELEEQHERALAERERLRDEIETRQNERLVHKILYLMLVEFLRKL